jgi:hypothetical protein
MTTPFILTLGTHKESFFQSKQHTREAPAMKRHVSLLEADGFDQQRTPLHLKAEEETTVSFL